MTTHPPVSNSPSWWARLWPSLVLCVGGCNEAAGPTGVAAPTGATLEFVDTPVAAPTGTPFELPKVDAPGPNAPNAADCGTRTGRNAQGECEFLSTRDAGYVQRVLLPAGRFLMGRVPLRYDGQPARTRAAVQWPAAPPRVASVQSVWMDLHEVTRATYQACVDAGTCTEARCPDGSDGSQGAPTGEAFDERLLARLPQTCVTHQQAETFCRAQQARLPTQAEWEYAARGVDGRIYPWGNEIRDELGAPLIPTGVRVDTSYFHLLGFGSSGAEWVADVFSYDASLRDVLAGPFRSPKGPLAKAVGEWESRFLCPADRPGCKLGAEARTRHVIKGPAPAHVRAPYDRVPTPLAASTTPEGWAEVHAHPQVGFRCAADPLPEDPQLVVPASPPAIPYLTQAEGLEVFGGAVAEVVNQSEARRFCEQLRNPGDGDEVRSGWRLPTVDEVQRIAAVWRGPGPFWAADGAVEQDGEGWVRIDAQPDEGLLARCVRG